ncbi:MAG TPA: electron transport complex subunit RsxC [Rheinheimera sp.]|nr:electron transport complex subunit RsxC [Rheinheimera sp.]
MPSLFQQIQAGRIWDFHGGIHPPSRKTQTSQKPIDSYSLPARLYIPQRQHIGVAGRVLVKVGDHVLKGQALTAADNAMAVPVHAPTSGTIVDICLHPSAHPSALPEPVFVLEPDGLEQWRPRHALDMLHADKAQILQRIQQAGIAGMGGAGFPSHIKAGAAAAVDYLIINAVECEPYITADDVLMQHHSDTIVQGIEILSQLLQPKAVLIGIEDDKPAAIKAMQQAVAGKNHWFVRALPVKYPSGGEKQLIQRLTNKEVPSGRRPIDIGIVVQNVGTAFAIAQAVLEDIPLISRVVTVVGQSLSRPQNMYALLGTPVHELLSACGFEPQPSQRLIMGGPMMGFTLPDARIPVVKTTNCIIAPTHEELPVAGPELDCIRCGACTEACPVNLLPQQLLWYSKAKDHTQLQAHNLQDCIECGACAYVCPSEIPLVHYYRVAKADIRETQREALKAEQAKARFEARKERLEREKQERAERNKQLAAQRQQQLADQQKQQIAEAQARTQAATTELTHAEIVAERERKKAEARAYQAAKLAAEQDIIQSAEPTLSADDRAEQDPRKAAIAAALARAKAKKAQASGEAESTSVEAATVAAAPALGNTVEPQSSSSDDAKKAAVAAAIARAKAKKAQASGEAESTSVEAATVAAAPALGNTVEPHSSSSDDAKKAAVAAAIARAKAKKAQASGEAESTSVEAATVTAAPALGNTVEPQSSSSDDAKKAAVAAAIARAKAKKAQASGEAESTSVEAATVAAAPALGNTVEPQSCSSDDAKKAAVAAAIARAKAKKAQSASNSEAATDPTQADSEPPLADSDAVLPPVPQDEPQVVAQPEPVAANPSAEDAKKAAIAAAIARAKAKKAAQNPQEPS